MRAMPTPPEFVGRALSHLHRHLYEAVSLTALAAVAGVSAFHLQRAFKHACGHSPAERLRLLRLKRASMRLHFEPPRSVTEIAFEAGYENAESFSRAFRRVVGQSPSEFRQQPDWPRWRALFAFPFSPELPEMHVEIVHFPETAVAAVEHLGSTATVYESTRRLIEWRRANRVPPGSAATYGIHHDLRTQAESGYRVDLAVASERAVAPNAQGVVAKRIPGGRCAKVRHTGSREFIPAVQWLYTEWLPASGEQLRDFPPFFHYVNVGPDVAEHEMLTDVYLPITG
jgi:AraC family transcriptional regulator